MIRFTTERTKDSDSLLKTPSIFRQMQYITERAESTEKI